jgi:hypothetical protein
VIESPVELQLLSLEGEVDPVPTLGIPTLLSLVFPLALALAKELVWLEAGDRVTSHILSVLSSLAVAIKFEARGLHAKSFIPLVCPVMVATGRRRLLLLLLLLSLVLSLLVVVQVSKCVEISQSLTLPSAEALAQTTLSMHDVDATVVDAAVEGANDRHETARLCSPCIGKQW